MRVESVPLLGLLVAAGSGAVEPSCGCERLEKESRHELVRLPFYGVFDNFAFQVDAYNVTPLGQVTPPTLKTDPERAVRRTEGVGGVSDQVEVLPLPSNDDRIRLAVYRAIYGHSALDRNALMTVRSIPTIVGNGDLTLEAAVTRGANESNFAEISKPSIAKSPADGRSSCCASA